MLKEDLSLHNPLTMMGFDTAEMLPDGGFGAVLARAGVGKTSLLVQLSLNSLLSGNNILHVSLNDPVEKVALWYKEVFHKLADQHKKYSAKEVNSLWEDILPHRFILAFKEDEFSVAKLEKKLGELRKQNIFLPRMLLVDGMSFDASLTKEAISELKDFAKANGMHIWFSVRTHRHENPASDGMPVQLEGITDMFDAVIQLQPDGKDIHVNPLKGSSTGTALLLDPATLVIQNQ